MEFMNDETQNMRHGCRFVIEKDRRAIRRTGKRTSWTLNVIAVLFANPSVDRLAFCFRKVELLIGKEVLIGSK